MATSSPRPLFEDDVPGVIHPSPKSGSDCPLDFMRLESGGLTGDLERVERPLLVPVCQVPDLTYAKGSLVQFIVPTTNLGDHQTVSDFLDRLDEISRGSRLQVS